MPGISVTVSAEVVDLVTKFTVAKAASSGLSSELNKLGKEGAANGLDSVKDRLTQVATESIAATAKTKQLAAEMKALQPAADSASSALSSLAGIAGEFGLALSAGSVIGFGEQALTFAADVQHMADVLGISTTDLQAFQYAARQSGVGTDEADTLLRRFMNSMGQVEEGTGPASKAVEDLGVKSEVMADLMAGDPMKALSDIAAAALRMHDSVRLAHDEVGIFSRSGLDLNAMLPLLAQGFDTLKDKASGAGQMMDPELTKAAEDAEEKMSGFFAMLEGQGARALVDMAEKGGILVSVLKEAARLDDGLIKGGAATPQMDFSVPALDKIPDISGQIDAEAQATADKQGSDRKWEQAYEEMERKASETAQREADRRANTIAKEEARKRAEAARQLNEQIAAYGKDLDSQLIAIASSRASATIEIGKMEISAQKDLLSEEVSLGQITNTQKLQSLRALVEQEDSLDIERLQDEKQNSDLTLAQIEALNDKISVAQEKLRLDLAKVDRDIALDAVQSWNSILSPIESGFDGMLNNMISGNKSFGAESKEMLQKLVEDWAGARLKIEFDYLAGQAASAFGAQDWASKSVLGSVFGGGAASGASGAAGNASSVVAENANTSAVASLTAAITGHGAILGANTVATSTQTGASAVQSAVTAANTGVHSAGILVWAENTIATIANTIATDFEAIASAIPGFASGGTKLPGGFAIVGENGPEILGPSAAGIVTPNSAFLSPMRPRSMDALGGSFARVANSSTMNDNRRANNINIGPFNNNGGREWNAEDHARDIVRVLKNQMRLGHLR